MVSRGARSGGAGGTVMATSARPAAWVSPSVTTAYTWPPRARTSSMLPRVFS